ncbi:MAG TPA: hypothetical protein VMV33_17130 [Rhodocyclaceae bacterium]|nr:hypothetical protein [Rhodocyclaceae bacterium]
MADDRHYRGGDHYQLDDNSGFKVRASATRMQWNSIVTKPAHFNPRQPQDLVTGVRDEQGVAVPRSRQRNQFMVVGTIVTALGARGATTIEVEGTAGFNVGDACQVMLDSGEQFRFTLDSKTATTLSWLGAGLPATVGSALGDPLENQVLDLTSALVPPSTLPIPAY